MSQGKTEEYVRGPLLEILPNIKKSASQIRTQNRGQEVIRTLFAPDRLMAPIGRTNTQAGTVNYRFHLR